MKCVKCLIIDLDDTLCNTFSDLVKEVYGTRSPARKYGHLFYYYDETSEKKQMIWDDLCDRLEETMAEELEAHHRKIAMF